MASSISIPSRSTTLPPTHRALLLNSTRDPYDITVVSNETPQPGPGSAIVRILASGVLTYNNKVYSGKKPYPYPTPFVPGSGSIGRIAAVHEDATQLTPGTLVFFDCFIRARDDPNALILSGLSSGFTKGSTALMSGPWRNGTYAEYSKVPLENCFPLDETRLCTELGYTIDHLMYLFTISVPFGGLRSVDLRAGEKVLVTPAAGMYGSAAVVAALSMGARVVAIGRNLDTLNVFKSWPAYSEGRLTIVQNTGDVEADIRSLTKDGTDMADVFFDISPGKAIGSPHYKSCIQALRRGGRVSYMGAHFELPLPAMAMTLNDITFKAKWMYEPEDVRAMIKLAEAGYLKLGEENGIKTVGKFPLEKFAEAFDVCSKMSGPGLQVIIAPSMDE
ncbi:hypothetical protein RBB50_009935 [Rhinocladiella similis]